MQIVLGSYVILTILFILIHEYIFPSFMSSSILFISVHSFLSTRLLLLYIYF